MKRKIIILLLFIPLVSLSAIDSILDTEEYDTQVDEYGIPTLSGVASLKTQADRFYANNDWGNALEVYKQHAKESNFLANIISQGMEPYYSASYDEKNNFVFTSTLVPYARKSNNIKKDRNISFLRMGICYYNLGDSNKALSMLMKALDLIDIDSTDSWNEARTYLYKIIGYTGGSIDKSKIIIIPSPR